MSETIREHACHKGHASLHRTTISELRWRRVRAARRKSRLFGNRDEALRCARRRAELVPGAHDAWFGPSLEADLAFVYAWTGDTERAIDAYARLLALPVLANPDVIGEQTLEHGIW